MGGATCARPEYRRMMSASDRRHLARLGSGLSTRVPPGLLRPRSGPTARVGFGEPARTLQAKNLTCPPQARTGLPAPRLRLSAATGQEPVRWLALHASQRDPPASGTPMASASSRALPHVPANPERPSSRLDQHVHVPSGSGSPASVARVFGGGEKVG